LLTSSLCTRESLASEPLLGWVRRLRPAWFLGEDPTSPVPLHRKLWEWAFIAQSLHERGMLAPGRRGLGFGVGQEPLAALFAGLGCEIVATDLPATRARRAGWTETNQHAAGPSDLPRWEDLCPPDAFSRLVSFRAVDMGRIPADLQGFDFAWSSCALEHLGSIVHGQDFVVDSLRCLRPGGVGVHTTEFNLSSDHRTVTRGETVLLRSQDVAWLADRVGGAGGHVDLDRGDDNEPVADPPYGYPHLRVRIGPFVATSLGLVVPRGDVIPHADHSPGRVAIRALATARRRVRSLLPGVRAPLE
jgi:hypothetical protein